MPKGAGQIKNLLEKYGDLDSTLIIYESPYRVKKLLKLISETLGNRKVCLAKDISKLYESISTKTVDEFIKKESEIVEKGEYVVLIAKKDF